jgi:hypothetical protein
VGFTAGVASFFLYDLLQLLHIHAFTDHERYRVLTQLPYFPIQILEGLWLGWVLGRRFTHRSMVWVWVLPTMILCYALIELPENPIAYTSAIALAERNRSVVSYFFGSGCKAEDRCIDQLIFTMPFYASVAYSVGALVGRRSRPKIATI